jgi:hypothetical protein
MNETGSDQIKMSSCFGNDRQMMIAMMILIIIMIKIIKTVKHWQQDDLNVNLST